MTANIQARRAPPRPDSDNSIVIVSLGLALVMVAGAGCDSAAKKTTGGAGGAGPATGGGAGESAEAGTGGAGTGGTGTGGTGTGGTGMGTGDAGTDGDAPTQCHQALDDQHPWGGCPATYSDTSWKEPICRLPPFALEERDCGAFRSRTIDWSTHGYTCYYDSAGQTLIGARFFDDIPTFCDHTSSTLTVGEVPSLVACAMGVDLLDTCLPDGGVADAGPRDAGNDGDASAVCRGGQADARAPVGPGCPLSFTGTACQRAGVVPIEAQVTEQQCEGYRQRSYGFGIFASQCYYDPTMLTLVAAVYFDDTPHFCGGSLGITYGVVPPAGICEGTTTIDQPCASDASAD